jgi:hypothetical protein
MMAALDFSLAQHKQIVIAVASGAGDTHELLRLVWQRFLPFRVLPLADGDQGQLQLARWLPWLSIMRHKHGRTSRSLFLCFGFVLATDNVNPEAGRRYALHS